MTGYPGAYIAEIRQALQEPLELDSAEGYGHLSEKASKEEVDCNEM